MLSTCSNGSVNLMYRLSEVSSRAYVVTRCKDLSTYLLLLGIAAFKRCQVELLCVKELGVSWNKVSVLLSRSNIFMKSQKLQLAICVKNVLWLKGSSNLYWNKVLFCFVFWWNYEAANNCIIFITSKEECGKVTDQSMTFLSKFPY